MGRLHSLPVAELTCRHRFQPVARGGAPIGERVSEAGAARREGDHLRQLARRAQDGQWMRKHIIMPVHREAAATGRCTSSSSFYRHRWGVTRAASRLPIGKNRAAVPPVLARI